MSLYSLPRTDKAFGELLLTKMLPLVQKSGFEICETVSGYDEAIGFIKKTNYGQIVMSVKYRNRGGYFDLFNMGDGQISWEIYADKIRNVTKPYEFIYYDEYLGHEVLYLFDEKVPDEYTRIESPEDIDSFISWLDCSGIVDELSSDKTMSTLESDYVRFNNLGHEHYNIHGTQKGFVLLALVKFSNNPKYEVYKKEFYENMLNKGW